MYEEQLRVLVSQGDVFGNVPVADIKDTGAGADPEVSLRRGPAMLISNDCDLDNKPYILVAEVRPLSDVDRNHWAPIREGRSRRTFHLEEHPGRLPESYVDFTRIHRLHKGLLTGDSSADTPRMLSLVDEERLALQRSLAVFFGVPPTIDPPQAG